MICCYLLVADCALCVCTNAAALTKLAPHLRPYNTVNSLLAGDLVITIAACVFIASYNSMTDWDRAANLFSCTVFFSAYCLPTFLGEIKTAQSKTASGE